MPYSLDVARESRLLVAVVRDNSGVTQAESVASLKQYVREAIVLMANLPEGPQADLRPPLLGIGLLTDFSGSPPEA